MLVTREFTYPNFLKCFQHLLFFQETSSFWFLGNAENPTDLKPYWSGAGLRHPEWVCHLTGKNDQPMTNLTIYLYIYIYIIISFKGTTIRFILSWASTGFNILGKFNNQNGHQHRENGIRGNHAEANLDKPSWAATTGTARSAYPICHWHNCLQKLRVCSYQTWLSEVDSFQRCAEAINTWYMVIRLMHPHEWVDDHSPMWKTTFMFWPWHVWLSYHFGWLPSTAQGPNRHALPRADPWPQIEPSTMWGLPR